MLQRKPELKQRARGQTDRQTDRQDRPDETRPDRPTRPSPKTTPRKHRHCTGKRAPGAKPQKPYLPAQGWLSKKVRVTCSSLVDKRAPPPPATGGHAEACPRCPRTKDPGRPEGPRAPSLPEGCGTLRAKSVAANTKTETEKQERERAEDLKASSPCATRHQTRERETQAAPKNRKKTMAPRPLGAQNKVCES